MNSRRSLKQTDYQRLLAFRDGLRVFLRWSEGEARAIGLTPAQHQLLLAIRGHPGAPSIADVADHLLLRHHSVVELVDRAVGARLVERYADDDDQRVVRLRVTARGESMLAKLAEAHLKELSRLHRRMGELSADLP